MENIREMFCEIFLVPQNIVMDLNNVMRLDQQRSKPRPNMTHMYSICMKSNPHQITSNILPLNRNTISRPRRLDLSLQPLPDSIFWQQSGKLSTTNNTQVIVTTWNIDIRSSKKIEHTMPATNRNTIAGSLPSEQILLFLKK